MIVQVHIIESTVAQWFLKWGSNPLSAARAMPGHEYHLPYDATESERVL